MKRLAATVIAAGWLGCADNATPPPLADVEQIYDCVPDRDGVLTAEELPVAIGQTADFYVSPPGQLRTVDVAGTGAGDQRIWDFSREYADDTVEAIGPIAVAGRWYQSEFGGAEFVTTDGTYDSIYHLDDAGLWLHGVASTEPEPAAGRTLWRYQEPVAVLRLPLALGDTWTETGVVTDGVVQGLPYRTTDTYEVAVDGQGRLDVPYLRLSPALRLRSHVTVMPEAGGASLTRRQVLFLFECIGEVARIDSQPDEPSADFDRAAHVRRFAL